MTDLDLQGTTKITLKPSYLIVAKVTRAGGLTITNADEKEVLEGDAAVKTWSARRDIPSLSELKRANAAVVYARKQLDKVCYRMGSALVCAKENKPYFDEAVATVRKIIADINPSLTHSKLYSSFIIAEIVTDDQEAALALKQDISAMAVRLSDAIKAADPKAIRETIQSMKGIESLVPDIQSEKLKAAVKVAKQYAHQIVLAASGKVEEVEGVKKELDLAPIDEFRFAFLEQPATMSAGEFFEAGTAAVSVDAGIGAAPEIESA